MSAGSRAQVAAAALFQARLSGVALPHFPAPVPTTLAEAYDIQRRLRAALGGAVLGWKVGRIPPALVDYFGAVRLAGPVLRIDALDGSTPGTASIFGGGAAAIESEVMLRLNAVPQHIPATDDEAFAFIDDIRAGFEVASSPARDVHDHAPCGIIADIGINNGLLLGPSLGHADFSALMVETQIDGVTVGTGRAIDVLDGPWGSFRFLVDLHLRSIIELAAGQWISAGAITGVHPIALGQTATARFGDGVQIACIAAAEAGFKK
ncbi:2-keto-4-pentenoate hydratase [Sphingopyxis sp.]|uniref:2-keto-4-pentenoate hydratase n=1 Tax=Sphingopyxis sp. TaxID=1908224 RepID=UPI003D10D699